MTYAGSPAHPWKTEECTSWDSYPTLLLSWKLCRQHLEELADGDRADERRAETGISSDVVAVSPSDSRPLDVPVHVKVPQNRLRRSLGDSHHLRDVADAQPGRQGD